MMKKIAHIIIAIIIISTLIKNDYFCNSIFADYFFYIISGGVLLVFAGLSFLKNKNQSTSLYYTPIVIFFLLACYYLLQGLVISGNVNTMQTYLFTSALLLIALTFLFKNKTIDINPICKVITILAIVESLICVLQFEGIIHSQNEFLKVSGTWENPNITAMFLAMSIPAVLSGITIKKKGYGKWLKPIVFLIICIACLQGSTLL